MKALSSHKKIALRKTKQNTKFWKYSRSTTKAKSFLSTIICNDNILAEEPLGLASVQSPKERGVPIPLVIENNALGFLYSMGNPLTFSQHWA